MSLLGTVFGATAATMATIVAGTAVAWTVRGQRQARRRQAEQQAVGEGTADWPDLAAEYDLYFDPEGPGLHGEVDDLPVSVEIVHPSRGVYTRIRVAGVPRDLLLAPASGGGSTGYAETGDPTFDLRTVVSGDPAVITGWLDHRTRALWLERIADHRPVPAVRDGAVGLSVDRILEERELSDVLDRCVLLAQALRSEGPTIEHRLERVFLGDPVVEVRRRALEQLLERLGHRRQDEVIERALRDDEPGVRLMAARHVGDARVLAGLVTEAAAAEAIRREALDLLAERGGQRLEDTMDSLLVDIEDPLAPRAIRHLGERGGSDAVDQLLGLVLGPLASGSYRAEPAAVAAADALAGLGDRALAGLEHRFAEGSRTEDALLVLLEAHPTTDLRRAVYRALARVGTLASMGLLREQAERDSKVSYEARRALRAILSRSHSADAGALSVAEGPEDTTGAVSLTDDRAGQITVVGGEE